VTVATLLAELRSRDVQVWVEGDQLRCNAPAGVLTADLRDVLRQRKADMIQFLRSAETFSRQQRAIVPLQPRGNRTPIFGVPGHNGDVFLYRPLMQQLGDDQPFFGLQLPGLEDGREPLTSVEDLGAYFAGQIREFKPTGPYVLTGYCAGATIAFETARQLIEQGAKVDRVIFFAGAYPDWYRPLSQFREHIGLRLKRMFKHIRAFTVMDAIRRYRSRTPEVDPVAEERERLKKITANAVRNYKPVDIATRVCQILPSKDSALPRQATISWRSIVPRIEEYYGPDGCEGDVMLLDPHAGAIADLIRKI